MKEMKDKWTLMNIEFISEREIDVVKKSLHFSGKDIVKECFHDKTRYKPFFKAKIKGKNCSLCQYQSYLLAGVSLLIFYDETKRFLQITQQELILCLMVTSCEDDQRQP